MTTQPIILLDEDQQRTLQQTARSYSNATSTQMPPPRSSFDASSILSYPTTPPSEPREPRTNFTAAGAGGVKNPFATNEPRTNFTSAAMSARQQHQRLHEHVAATGGRTGDALASHNPNARLNSTFNSSPKTNFTTQRYAPADVDPSYGDFMPVMLSDRLSDTDEIDEKDTLGGVGGVGYVGNSSRHKLSVKYILIGVVLGIILGVLCSTLKVSELAAKWIELPGALFLRALKALVIPYVFCSVAVAIGDIVFVGKVSIVGLQTFKVFLIMWVSTVVMGLGVALLFRPLFRLDRTFVAAPTNALGFMCADNNMMLELQSDNSLACTRNATAGGVFGPAAFEVVDVNNALQKNVKRALALMTVSDQILAILYLIVPKNIVETLANGDLLSTITFAMVFGAIAGRNYFTKTRHVNYLYLTLLQLRNTFFLAMEWVIWLTPVAVISTIAGSFATNQDALRQLQDVYVYVLAVLCAALLQLLVTQPAIIFLLTRCNPYKHMAHMTQAYVFAFSVSSSLATAPVTLACVKKARVCSQSLANFVISIGVCSNMSGASFYYPVAIIWLAESSGNGDALTPWRLLAIALLSVLGCAGTPPIPNAGVVLMATVYKTVFGISDLPATFPLYIAVDFLVDRIATVCNVNDDIMALKVIAENTDETIVGDHLGERE